MLMPVKTLPELFRRAFSFWVIPNTGVAELADRDNLGWVRTTYVRSVSARRQQDGTLWIDRLLVETAAST